MFYRNTIKLVALFTIFFSLSLHLVSQNKLNAFQVSPAYLAEEMYLGQEVIFKFKINIPGEFTANITDSIHHSNTSISDFLANLMHFMALEISSDQVYLRVSPEDLKHAGYFKFYIEVVDIDSSSVEAQLNTTFLSSRTRVLIPIVLNIYAEKSITVPFLTLDRLDFLPSLFVDNVTHFNIELSNASSYFVIPRGVLTLKKSLGVGTANIQRSINLNNKIVFPDDSAHFQVEVPLNDPFILGIYDVQAAMVVGKDNHVIIKNSTQVFIGSAYVFPLSFGITFLLYRFVQSRMNRKHT